MRQLVLICEEGDQSSCDEYTWRVTDGVPNSLLDYFPRVFRGYILSATSYEASSVHEAKQDVNILTANLGIR